MLKQKENSNTYYSCECNYICCIDKSIITYLLLRQGNSLSNDKINFIYYDDCIGDLLNINGKVTNKIIRPIIKNNKILIKEYIQRISKLIPLL